jgi:hypothetical protein
MTTITVRTGTEGPRHDPYHFEEVTVERDDGRKVTLHLGLAVWSEASGGPLPERTDSEPDAFHMFERYSGVSYVAMMKAYRAIPLRRMKAHRCGMKYFRDVDGYPGETMTVCGKCGDVIDSYFDRSAVE